MHFFRIFEQWVRECAILVPLEWFVFIGSFAEEVISPIPSALIMGTAGSLALTQGKTLWYLLWLAVIGNLGKTLGAWFYYFLGDKLEDFLIRPINRLLGIRHEEIENIGKRFIGHHWKDGGVLFFLRLIPFFPSTPVSLACGIIKMDIRVYLAVTYAGNFFKDLFYIYAGYAGLAAFHTLWRKLDHVKFGIDVLVGIVIVGFLFSLYIHRGRGKELIEKYFSFSKKNDTP